MKIVENHLVENNHGQRYHMCEPQVSDLRHTNFDLDSPTLEGDIFRWSRKEYGRCVSKVYIDDVGAVGWVFQKREQYEDSKETFIHETWVTLYDEYEYRLHATPHVLK